VIADALPALRRVIRIECLLRRAQLDGHVLQVHADTRPGAVASAHRIDEDIGWLEVS
jgi:hypothetical protein